MKILVSGSAGRMEEFKQCLGPGHEADYFLPEELPAPDSRTDYDLYVALNLDEEPFTLELYADLTGKPVLVCAVKTQLAQMVYSIERVPECTLIGINALPTFLNRSKKEISLYREEDAEAATALMQQLGWDWHRVDDRVGMVSPRIVCMIINEAYYTLQEGTATAEDIDESMKLGTNYPYGPFEWSRRMGISEIFETLEALYLDTQDERYKICPLLRTDYLRAGVAAR